LNNPAVGSVTALFSTISATSGSVYKNQVALIDLQQRFEIITALADDVLEAADSIQVELSY
jgi:hypothetical protein